ncbi:MAG: TIGR03085 family protein [Micromonosporaceae bacterium]|nr:TIGR03085 family protein [Micromonosporaceae bacterium]
MTAYAQRERADLAALLADLGPDAPTLCGDWTAADLAAHLAVRDRRPDSGPGLLISAFSGWTESVRREALKSHSYAELVAMVAEPPWWSPISNPLVHESANLMEFFIHHEDVRRARPDWKPRELPAEEQRMLWRRLSLLKAMLRRTPATVTLSALGHGEQQTGRGGEAQVRITGNPAELILFCSGRQQIADVELQGPEKITERLHSANFGL